ncbi:GNAT family N-acetyltransferase [Mucilaginibacter daejeonensis]|uniref:GNAT family N-acetyltransferase n=1 Tax=Mucilaginibacter daejeonensis TaxID=398049 RepID=UPI001D1763EF|nr:GNAT family N-acetyltransferase [Mucilaginibacter daejeonensis]UEG52027.1 GNAT family N-acetyltransferase [Mucilaginibacter daejeonensis]
MEDMITTERLILRELVPDDGEGMFQLDADPLVHTYLGQRPISTRQQALDTITYIRQQYVDNGIGRWGVEEKDSGRFVVWAGLKYITEPVNGHVNYHDLGYRLLRDHWGKGYASEAAYAWVDHAFNKMKLPALYGMANVNNVASIKILERVGLIRTNTFCLDNEAHHWFELKNDQCTPKN